MPVARKKKRLSNEPDDHALGRSKGGFSTKIHVKTDGQGHILGVVLTAGQCHESTQFEAVMESGPLPITSSIADAAAALPPAVEPSSCEFLEQEPVSVLEPVPPSTNVGPNTAAPAKRPKAIAGDKAYSAQRIRDWCNQRHIEDVIPTKSNETRDDNFDKDKYRQRNIVERAIGWLKECRRVLSRFEKYALHYLAIIKIAVIQRFMAVDL